MTYDEFVEKLAWYFSRRDINELDIIAYESADIALREPDNVWNEINDGTWCNQNEYLHFAGRDFILDLICDTPGDILTEFQNNLEVNIGIKMTESNAAALLADIESGAF